MDPVSAAASITGIVGFAGTAGSLIHTYISSVKHASVDAQALEAEVTVLKFTLGKFGSFLHNQRWPNRELDESTVLFQTLNGCTDQILSLLHKLRKLHKKHGISRIFQTLKWPLEKEDTMKEIETLHRYTQTFHFLLSIEGL